MFGENLYQCFSGHRRSSRCRCRCPTLPAPAASCSSSSSSSVVFKHFNCLFDPGMTPAVLPPRSTSPAGKGASFFPSSSSSGDGIDGNEVSSCLSERDLSSAIASRRLLPASPGRSNSSVDSSAAPAAFGIRGISAAAVPTYSPDPYGDFRRSMEEMVAALGLDAAGDHRARRLHELLLCYLTLNRKHAHKYIVSAFFDLLLALAAATSAAEDNSSTARFATASSQL
ncbi:transcription repressor OFP12-like [Zingiber officinale]|uniref:transcription repressor OFP12-like n=1 Tax=Zingiber officinale TaxID=94328 RepID=UPI001C4D5A52|nr:transcription repressor OFP12-like [Zingiber officinale]